MAFKEYFCRDGIVRRKHSFFSLKNTSMKAFTLSEVLIALVIIGIIAAITIPQVVAHKREQEVVSRLRKAYSTWSNAYNLAVINEGSTPDEWDLISAGSAKGANNLLKIMSKYINNLEICGTQKGCFENVNYKQLNGDVKSNYYSFNQIARAITLDGQTYALYINDPKCESGQCAAIEVDVNGSRKPNVLGKDTFAFRIEKDGVFPAKVESGCDPKKHVSGKYNNGFGCTAHVLQQGNLDYSNIE